MSDTPETQEAVERWQQGKINIFDEMARLERERDEAREALQEISELVHRDGAWDNPNDISGSLVTIDDICEEAAK